MLGSCKGIFPCVQKVHVLLKTLSIRVSERTADQLAWKSQEICSNYASVDELGAQSHDVLLQGCSKLVRSISLLLQKRESP